MWGKKYQSDSNYQYDEYVRLDNPSVQCDSKPRKRKSAFNFKKLLLFLIIFTILGGIFDRLGKEDSETNSEKTENADETPDVINNGSAVEEEDEVTKLSYYFYNQLDTNDKKTYDAIFNAMLNMEAKVQIEETNKDTMEKVMMGIMADHPELFWCDGTYAYITYDRYSEFSPTYLYGKQQRDLKQNEIDMQAKNILSQIQSNWTDYEKIKYIFETIVESVEYVTGAPDNQNICSSLVNKKSVCAGYTRACQYLLQQLGIECLYVPGMVRGTESHAWNIVKCNGNYYHMDATFGDRAFEKNTQSNMPAELNINYSYLCCSDREMYTDCYSDMVYQLPTCNLLDLNYFKMQGCYYEYYSDYVLQDLRNAVFNGEKVWQCQFSNQQDYQTMMNVVKDGAFTEIVGDYLTSIGNTESRTVWYSEDDTKYTISFWY